MTSNSKASRNNPTVARVVAERLRDHGVEVVFGQSLPSTVILSASDIGIRQIGYRAENAGGIMADGYARISHKIPVVTAQNGPAAALLVAPLAEASKASVPIVAIVQEVPTVSADKNAFQELDHLAIFAGCAKWVRRLPAASRAADYVDMAFRAAAAGRPGPAVLLLPADLLLAEGTLPDQSEYLATSFPLDRTRPAPEQISAAADLLLSASAPVVLAGGGVHLSDASGPLARLQDIASLPVATTNMGKGSVAETHPLSLGVTGNATGRFSLGRQMRNFIEDADVVLLIGTRTNENGTDSWSLFRPETTIIHIDVDGTEVGRNYASVRLVGDAKLTLEALLEEISGRNTAARDAARADLEVAIGHGRAAYLQEADSVLSATDQPIRPERIMAELDRLIDKDTIVVADASYSTNWITTYLTARVPGQRFLTPRGLAGIGWGFPMALGAQCAAPGSRVVALVGDGGFGHCWSELETARRMGLPVTVIVLNNGILGYQMHAEDKKYGAHTDVCTLMEVDHAAIARACGCDGVTVTDPGGLAAALSNAFASDRPTLVDVATSPDAYPPLNLYQVD